MRIMLINQIKPYKGSGSGLTEYAYQLEMHLKPMLTGKDSLDNFYALNEAKRNDINGLINVNTKFKSILKNIPENKYDIIHITNQEIGFAAKILKKSSSIL